jgi:hypothetical protein
MALLIESRLPVLLFLGMRIERSGDAMVGRSEGDTPKIGLREVGLDSSVEHQISTSSLSHVRALM